MFNPIGQNVYPAEVERILLENNNVSYVKIYGVDDTLQEHIIKAKVTLKRNGSQEQEKLIHWCKDSMSPYKIPKVIEFN